MEYKVDIGNGHYVDISQCDMRVENYPFPEGTITHAIFGYRYKNRVVLARGSLAFCIATLNEFNYLTK